MKHKYHYFSTVISLFVFLYMCKQISEHKGYETVYYDVKQSSGIEISYIEIERPKDGFVISDNLLSVWIPPIPEKFNPIAEIRATCRLNNKMGLYEYKRPKNLGPDWIKDEFKPILALEPKFKNLINLCDLRYCVKLKTDPDTYIPVLNSKISGKDAQLEIGILPKCSGNLQWKIMWENNYKEIPLLAGERTSITIRLRDVKKKYVDLELNGTLNTIFNRKTVMEPLSFTIIIPE